MDVMVEGRTDQLLGDKRHKEDIVSAFPMVMLVTTLQPNGTLLGHVINPTDLPVRIPRRQQYGSAYTFEEVKGGPPISRVAFRNLKPATREKREKDVQDLIDKSMPSPYLETRADVMKLKTLLLEWYDVFAWDNTDFGNTTLVEHKIRLKPGHKIISDPYKPVPRGVEPKVGEVIQGWADSGVIEESDSPWNARLVIAYKKSGLPRVCCDFRSLNAQTIKDKFPIPNMQSLSLIHI